MGVHRCRCRCRRPTGCSRSRHGRQARGRRLGAPCSRAMPERAAAVVVISAKSQSMLLASICKDLPFKTEGLSEPVAGCSSGSLPRARSMRHRTALRLLAGIHFYRGYHPAKASAFAGGGACPRNLSQQTVHPRNTKAQSMQMTPWWPSSQVAHRRAVGRPHHSQG